MEATTQREAGVHDRRRRILELLEDRGQLSVPQLALELGVSEMTVRRDFDSLERDCAVKRVRGGVIAATSRSYEPPYTLRAASNADAKLRIGRAAAAMVRDGETVALDAGSSVLAVATALAGRRNLTIVTPCLRAAWALADNPDIRIIVTGGVVRPAERAMNGVFSERAFAELNCDTFFMGIGAVHATAGFTEYTLDETRTKQAALRSSRRRLVIADSSKLDKVAFVRVAAITEVDGLITDAGADEQIVRELRDLGLDVFVV